MTTDTTTGTDPDTVLVLAGGHTHRVRLAHVPGQPGQPPRDHVVAWTTGDEPTGDKP